MRITVYLLIWKLVSVVLLISVSFLDWLLLLFLLLLLPLLLVVAVSENHSTAGKEILNVSACLQASHSTTSRSCRTLPFHLQVTSTYSPCVAHFGPIPVLDSNWTCLIPELLLELTKPPKISSSFVIPLLIKPLLH